MSNIVIIDAIRTPVGLVGGVLSSLNTTELGSIVISALYKRNHIKPDVIDRVFMGSALQAGQGATPARQAALLAGLNPSTVCCTINNGCSSGLKAVMASAEMLTHQPNHITIAGGMESMSHVPYYVSHIRYGRRSGDLAMHDGILHDSLNNPLKKKPAGIDAEAFAQNHGITREDQDSYAATSYKKWVAGKEAISDETISITVRHDNKATVVQEDEGPVRYPVDSLSSLGPKFHQNGTITAATSAPPGDGAAALLIMTESKARELDCTPIARIINYAESAGSPADFPAAAGYAISDVLSKSGIDKSQIDLFEINESLAICPLSVIQQLDLDPDKVNVHGGNLSVGHPPGLSGARILVSLVHALKFHKKRYGCAALSNISGEAASILIEHCHR